MDSRSGAGVKRATVCAREAAKARSKVYASSLDSDGFGLVKSVVLVDFACWK